jgi:hypothetical protein
VCTINGFAPRPKAMTAGQIARLSHAASVGED